jgi:DNA-binding response OmpR family regulator
MENCSDTSKLKILLVDDDIKLCQLITDYLEPMGYSCCSVHDGASALEIIKQNTFHAIMLDVMMPHMDGLETLRRLREFSDIPVLMLTALDAETDRIVGLEMGADDYLPKSFSSRELLARLRAATRRYFKANTNKKTVRATSGLCFKDIEINIQSRQVFLKDKILELTPFEFDILVCLATDHGVILSRDQILDRVAERTYEVFDRSIDVHISSLRRKLQDDPKKPSYIQTVRSSGYMFIGEMVRNDEL